MRVCYSEGYFVSLPDKHPFPMAKFPVLQGILLREGLIHPSDICEPIEASWEDLRLVHTGEYLDKLADGALEQSEERRLGLPWSEGLVRRSRSGSSRETSALPRR